MVCGVCRGDRLTSGPRGRDGRLVGCFSRGGMGGDRGLHGCAGLHFTIRPGTSDLQRTLWASVVTRSSEEIQHTIRAIGSPTGEKHMALSIERPASVSRHKASISHGELVWSVMGVDSVGATAQGDGE